MDKGNICAQYFTNLQTEYFIGDYTHCWESWQAHNVTPGYNKFYFIVDGECYFKINGIEYIAKKGDLFLLPYDSTQDYYHISPNLITKYWFHFTATCSENDLFQLITLPHVVNLYDNKKEYNYVLNLMQNIVLNGKEHDIGSIINQKSNILMLIAFYIEKSFNSLDTKLVNMNLLSIINYINNDLAHNFTLKQLCSILSFHPNYFVRYFKGQMGVPPIEYIFNQRIIKAKKILQTTNDPIQTIATEVGFRSLAFFSRAFKQKTGFSPSEYRKVASSKADISKYMP